MEDHATRPSASDLPLRFTIHGFESGEHPQEGELVLSYPKPSRGEGHEFSAADLNASSRQGLDALGLRSMDGNSVDRAHRLENGSAHSDLRRSVIVRDRR